MQFKTKALLGAIALAMAGQASAGISPGDLLLEVWDPVTNVSYTADLGVTEAQFESEIGLTSSTGTTTLTAPLVFNTADPLFAATFGSETTTSNIEWNVVASNQTGASGPTGVHGVFSMSDPGNNPFTNGGLTGANAKAIAIVNETENANSTGNNSVAYSTYNAGNEGGGTNWGDTLGNSYNGGVQAGNNTNTVGFGYSSVDAVFASGTPHGSGAVSVATFEYLNQGGSDDTFSLSSTGALTFASNAPVSTTPIPAAAWLLGSGLLGLFGIGRRKSA